VRVVELVEAAAVAVDDEDVAVAAGVRAALDRDVGGQRVARAVGLVGVVERHRHALLRAAHDLVRDADRAAVVEARAEVGLCGGVRADGVDERGRVGRDRQTVDALVERVGRRQDRALRRLREAMRAGPAHGQAGQRTRGEDDEDAGGHGARS
jgi:hypothetical protein